VLFKSLPFNTNIGLDVLQGTTEISGSEKENDVPAGELDGYDWGNRYSFEDIGNADEITAVQLSRNQLVSMDVKYRIRVRKGKLLSDGNEDQDLRGQVIASNKTIRHDDQRQTFTVSWKPADDFLAESEADQAEFDKQTKDRAIAIAKNTSRNAAYQVLRENINRFKERLQRLVLRRRRFFTRVILNAIEPEEIVQLLESVTLGSADGGSSNSGIPLSSIAHTIPIGMTTSAFVLKLKRLDKDGPQVSSNHSSGFSSDWPNKEVNKLLHYADEIFAYFADYQQHGGIARTDHIYVPTGGLFAEAVLGRSNGAEILDPERFFHWDEAPIPNAAPTVSPVSTDTRFQRQDLNVTVPQGNLTIVQPQGLPDPTGLQQALSAIQSGNLFRDMSKSEQLASIVGKLADLSQALGVSAGNMTGDAARQALQSAADIGKAALSAAQALQTETAKGEQLAQAAKLDRAVAAAPVPPPAGAPAPPAAPPPPRPQPSLRQETFRKQAGLDGTKSSGQVTQSLFTFLFNSIEGAAFGDFMLSLRKDGLVVDDKSAIAGTALQVTLRFETGVAQLPVELTDFPGPLILSIAGVASDGSAALVARADAFLLPPNRTNYVFRIDLEMETIQMQATSSDEVKKALTGKLDFTVAGEPDEAPSSGSGSAKKPKVSKKPKLPTSVLALLASLIDVSATLSVGGELSDTSTNSTQKTFVVRVPTGDLKIALDERLST
jgi:hypothetical protein